MAGKRFDLIAEIGKYEEKAEDDCAWQESALLHQDDMTQGQIKNAARKLGNAEGRKDAVNEIRSMLLKDMRRRRGQE